MMTFCENSLLIRIGELFIFTLCNVNIDEFFNSLCKFNNKEIESMPVNNVLFIFTFDFQQVFVQ